MTCALWRDRLDAYIDGEATQEEPATINEHLHSCPDCAAEALERMQIKRATRVAALRFTPPLALRRRIENTMAPRRHRFAFLASPTLAIAAALALVAIVSSVFFVNRSERRQSLARLVDMHVAALASPNPVDVVSSDRHTVKPWFQGKLPFTFNLPGLEGSQYKLIGGKLVYADHQPGAQLIYELRKHEFSVFIAQEDTRTSKSAYSAGSENGFSTESWSAAGLHYAVVSDAAAGDVHALEELIRGAQQP